MRLLKKKTRRVDPCRKLELEKVIGLTTRNCSGFASNFLNGDFAYLAGCVVVVYNVDANRQVRFLVASRTPKALTCVAYSHDGAKFIAAGESGHQPAVIVWDSLTGSCIAELKAHKYGVSCVEFSPNGKHLVSVGFPHDGFLCLWDWRNGTLAAKTRLTTAISPITSVHFSLDGNFFLTAGTKHLKYWMIGAPASRRVTAGIGTLAIEGNPVSLGSQKESSFVSISSASYIKNAGVPAGLPIETPQPIYALTTAGILCLLHSGVAIKKWVDLKVQQGFGLAVSESHIACACSNGVVRLFMQETLFYAGTLPKPAPYGYHGVTDEKVCSSFYVAHNAVGFNFPDAIACSFSASQKLAVIYGDHSLYVWDVHDLSKITRGCAYFSHNDCIWDISNLLPSQNLETRNSLHSVGDGTGKGSFVTCSADGTIRLWDLALETDTKEIHCEAPALDSKSANVYCKDVLGVIYSETRGDPIKKQFESEESVDLAQGFRSLAVSGDGEYLAAGDRSGNLCVYKLSTLDLISFQEAHDAEILTLNFNIVSEKTTAGKRYKDHCLLASGGRDRLIHVYDVDRGFDVIATLDDHSSSITTVKFACNGSKLLSCSADKSVVFRNIATTDSGCKSIRYHQEVASRGTVYDMDIDPTNKLAVTVGQDKKIKVLSLTTGKPVRSFKQDGDVGEPIKVCVDQSGSYLICSYTDKCLRIYDFTSGELVAHASGHAEVITGAIFLADCKHVISVSGDSCIFVWKLPTILSKTMRKKYALRAGFYSANSSFLRAQSEDGSGQYVLCSQPSRDLGVQIKAESADIDPNIHTEVLDMPQNSALREPSAFQFSISRLPKWAQTKVMDSKQATVRTDGEYVEPNLFHSSESRWAERLGTDGYRLFAEFMEDKTPPATVRPANYGARCCFTVECESVHSDSTPESSFGSHFDESPASPKGQQSVKKDTHWRTVHTVFFDELEFLQEHHAKGNVPPLSTANIEDVEPAADLYANVHSRPLNVAGPLASEAHQTIAKGDIVNLATATVDQVGKESFIEKVNLNQCCNAPDKDDHATLEYKTPPPRMCSIPDGEGLCSNSSKLGYNDSNHFEMSRVAEGNSRNHLHYYYNKMFMTEASSDEDESDEECSPNEDLFSMHFGKLSTAVKLESGTASARSSFSTRFFSRTSCLPAHTSLFQTSPREKTGSIRDSSETIDDQDFCIDAASLLATERECLKQLEQKGEVVHEVQNICDSSEPLVPSAEHAIDVLRNADSNAEELDTEIADSNIHKSISPSKRQGDDFHNGMPSTSFPSMDCKDSLINLDIEMKDKIDDNLEQQDGEATARRESKPEFENPLPQIMASTECEDDESTARRESKTEYEIPLPLIVVSSESEDDLDQSCPCSSCTALVLFDVSDGSEVKPVSNRTCLISKGPGSNYLSKELQCCPVQTSEGSAVDAVDTTENDREESDCSSHQLELSGQSGKEAKNELPRSIEVYETALKNLSDAAETALNLFADLRLRDKCDNEKTGVKSSSDLSDLAHGILPSTLEMVQRLCDFALPDQLGESRKPTYRASLSTDVGEKGTFSLNNSGFRRNNDHQSARSRQCTSSVAPSEVALDSVDIEAFVERYSERLSEKLSSQVLALVKKGIASCSEL